MADVGTKGKMTLTAAGTILIALSLSSIGWALTNNTKSPQQNEHPKIDYSKATFLGTRQIRALADDPRRESFSLITSWIPGFEHKGYFRYQLLVTVIDTQLATQPLYSSTPPRQGWGIPETVERLQACSFLLDIYDEGGFILQKIPLSFIRIVDASSVTDGLNANDSSQMDLNNYQSFLKANYNSSWDIAWYCPSNGEAKP